MVSLVTCLPSRAQPPSLERSERQEMEASMEEVLTAGRGTWLSEMQAAKQTNPMLFADCLRNVLKNRRVKTAVPSSEKTKYMGLKDPVLERAMVYAIREEPGLPALANALGNILSLEAEGKTAETGQGERIAKEILATDNFAPRGTLARVLRHFDSGLRLRIYHDLLMRWEKGELPADTAVGFLGPAYVAEKEPALKKQLDDFLRKMGSTPEAQITLAEEAAKARQKQLRHLRQETSENHGESNAADGNAAKKTPSLPWTQTKPPSRQKALSDSGDGRSTRWIQAALIVAGCLAFLSAIYIARRSAQNPLTPPPQRLQITRDRNN